MGQVESSLRCTLHSYIWDLFEKHVAWWINYGTKIFESHWVFWDALANYLRISSEIFVRAFGIKLFENQFRVFFESVWHETIWELDSSMKKLRLCLSQGTLLQRLWHATIGKLVQGVSMDFGRTTCAIFLEFLSWDCCMKIVGRHEGLEPVAKKLRLETKGGIEDATPSAERPQISYNITM